MTAVVKKETGKKLTGRHVLFSMLAFFGIMFAVNGVFLYYAITTHPGEQIENSYLQGLNYNRTLRARAAQAELGWQAEIGLSDDEPRILIARIFDRGDIGLSGLDINAQLIVAEEAAFARTVKLKDAGSGEYQVELTPDINGRVFVQLTAFETGETTFTADKTVIVP